MMTGSVVVATAGGQKKPPGKSKPKPAKKAKAKAKAADASLPEETDVGATTVQVAYGVRNKLWVDDVFRSIDHSLKSLFSQTRYQGAPTGVKDELRRTLLRTALQFAFRGQVVLDSGLAGVRCFAACQGLPFTDM